MDQRYDAMLVWLDQCLGTAPRTPEPVAGDASFRRYFRVQTPEGSRIVMDAPPEKESCGAFVALTHHWHEHGLHVPALLAEDQAQGFLLLEDLGDRLYLDELTSEASADRLYGEALSALVRLQGLSSPPDHPLPSYDRERLQQEMQLFPDWLLEQKLGLKLSSQEQAMLATTFATLTESALAQPRVTVHRDYHSRNLLVTDNNSPGIIDFQDAVTGPITYDAASLLRDCYVAWPLEKVYQWLEAYRLEAREAGLHQADEATFRQWFELMGIQRHLKASGIFARLDQRDGKPRYLADIPRTLAYIISAARRQPALEHFGDWLAERVAPAVEPMAGAT
ncbi:MULTISPECIES: aminoglycoside phosphotransferase family protein [Halomonadaceae]|uniref:Phosphotransferase n=1 Tax=Vreelandella halophila TaxID=86177 RepID=A0A9X5B6J2_9GAMM|nr:MULTISPECIES: phosphotransferase [Halomonas]MYL27252.1 phosphotransferase [Halomonas utahensis]MYL74454.1 phosphotransferase [Halomonas sp. 22501_18_FS]